MDLLSCLFNDWGLFQDRYSVLYTGTGNKDNVSVADYREMVKTLVCGVKTITWGAGSCKLSAPGRHCTHHNIYSLLCSIFPRYCLEAKLTDKTYSNKAKVTLLVFCDRHVNELSCACKKFGMNESVIIFNPLCLRLDWNNYYLALSCFLRFWSYFTL